MGGCGEGVVLGVLEKAGGVGGWDFGMGEWVSGLGNAWLMMVLVQVEETGQKNTVLTLYELMNGEMTVGQGIIFALGP